YILPTGAGAAFGLLLFLMLLAGLNYGNSLALFLTFLLAAFALVAMQQCHRNLLGIAVIADHAPAVFARTTGAVHLTLANPASLARAQVEAAMPQRAAVAADLPAHERQRLELPLPAPTRGIVRIERLRLATTHPFGLFRAWTWVHTPIEMMIYPRPHGALPMPAHSGHKSGARPRGGSDADEWLGLRPFRDGDSPRQVDWKAYAREAPLLVKEYRPAGSELHLFDFAQLTDPDTEARLSQLARWVLEAEAHGERYGVALPGVLRPPAWACAAFAGGVLLSCDRVPAWTAATALLLIAWRLSTERSGARLPGTVARALLALAVVAVVLWRFHTLNGLAAASASSA